MALPQWKRIEYTRKMAVASHQGKSARLRFVEAWGGRRSLPCYMASRAKEERGPGTREERVELNREVKRRRAREGQLEIFRSRVGQDERPSSPQIVHACAEQAGSVQQ